MQRVLLALAVLVNAVLVLRLATAETAVASKAPAPGAIYARIDINALGPDLAEEIRETPGLVWWSELDDQLLVLADEATLSSLERQRSVERLKVKPKPESLYLLRGARRDDFAAMNVDVLATGGRYAVVQARDGARPELPVAHEGHEAHASLLPFEPNQMLARQLANQRFAARAPDPRILQLADEVDPQRWFNDVVALAGYNRYTHGSEIDAARDWLVQQFESLPGLAVTTESFLVGSTTAWNVIATQVGTERSDDLYIVGAHYDSISQSPQSAAPGAEDNASGCAGVLEMARVFAAHPPAATIIFMCYSGEEQGLHGSSDHASDLVAAGLDDDVKGVLIMDMVGYTADADLDCLLETNSAHAALADLLAAAGEATDLRIVISFNPFGSDHVPYLNRGMPALLTIENDWDIYPCYHRTCDLSGNVSLAMGGETLKMNVMAMARMAGVGPIFSDGFESGNTSAWGERVP